MFQAQTGSASPSSSSRWRRSASSSLPVLRPSSQARKKHAELLGNLKKNDEVMTSGGIIGQVRDIKEVEIQPGVKEVRVTIESGTASVVVERGRIVRIGAESAPGAAQR